MGVTAVETPAGWCAAYERNGEMILHQCCTEHGHESAQKADACLERWLTDPSSVDIGWWYASERPCLECGEPTCRGARTRGVRRALTIPLCESHLNPECAVRHVMRR